MHCLICDKPLETEEAEVGDTLCSFPVYGGILCQTHGNYGSTKYDPLFEDEILHFVICDECLVKKADKIQREQFVKMATGPNKTELKIKIRETYKQYRTRILGVKKEHQEAFNRERSKYLAKKEHFWLPTPKNGRFICHICDKILDEEYIFQLEHFKQVWDGVCYGSKEAREEIEEEREYRACMMEGKAFEFWKDPEESKYSFKDEDSPD